MNTEDTHNKNYHSTTNEPIEGTPFRIVGDEEKRLLYNNRTVPNNRTGKVQTRRKKPNGKKPMEHNSKLSNNSN